MSTLASFRGDAVRLNGPETRTRKTRTGGLVFLLAKFLVLSLPLFGLLGGGLRGRRSGAGLLLDLRVRHGGEGGRRGERKTGGRGAATLDEARSVRVRGRRRAGQQGGKKRWRKDEQSPAAANDLNILSSPTTQITTNTRKQPSQPPAPPRFPQIRANLLHFPVFLPSAAPSDSASCIFRVCLLATVRYRIQSVLRCPSSLGAPRVDNVCPPLRDPRAASKPCVPCPTPTSLLMLAASDAHLHRTHVYQPSIYHQPLSRRTRTRTP